MVFFFSYNIIMKFCDLFVLVSVCPHLLVLLQRFKTHGRIPYLFLDPLVLHDLTILVVQPLLPKCLQR